MSNPSWGTVGEEGSKGDVVLDRQPANGYHPASGSF